MKLLIKSSSLGDDLSSFRKEVTDEIASEEKMLQKLQEPIARKNIFHVISIALIAVMATLIFLQNSVFFTWLIIGILLYSYNWLIFFIPTTTESVRPEDADVVPQINKERRWYVIRLLIKERKLGIEMALTMYLGGILPVALSFTIIFGLAMSFAIYFGFFTHFLAGGTATFILIQITLIILFYVMMLIIRPQAQGITRIGRYFRDKIKVAKSKGSGAFLLLILMVTGLSLVASVLVFGAILLPGFLTPVLWGDVDFLSISNIPIIAVVFVSQLVVMRHFQGIVSRRMAERRVKQRLLELNNDVLIKLDELAFLQENEKKQTILEDLKGKFYSIAIYDLIDQDIFGYSRIYLFGVRLRYVLDEDVILYITKMTKRALEANDQEMPRSPKEWQEPGSKKILPEDHKETLPKEQAGVAADLEMFEKYWKDKGTWVNVKKEYHKEGTPFPERGAGSDAAESLKESAAATAEVSSASESIKAEGSKENTAEKIDPTSGTSGTQPSKNVKAQDIVKQIDLGLIEMVSYTLFKAAFKNGLSIPIKREGVVDMDVNVKGKEITINTNQLYFSFPELTVWHIVYTHKGKPILEMGRGIENGMKIHRWHAIRLGLEVWNGSRKMNKQKKKQHKEMESKEHQRPKDE